MRGSLSVFGASAQPGSPIAVIEPPWRTAFGGVVWENSTLSGVFHLDGGLMGLVDGWQIAKLIEESREIPTLEQPTRQLAGEGLLLGPASLTV